MHVIYIFLRRDLKIRTAIQSFLGVEMPESGSAVPFTISFTVPLDDVT